MSEHELQKACITLWDMHLSKKFKQPRQALFAIPNGGARNPIVGAKLKAEGVRRGVPDLFLAVPFIPDSGIHNGLFMELKVGKNGMTPEQKEFWAMVTQNENYRFEVVRSVDEFTSVIECHLDAWINPDNHISTACNMPGDDWLLNRFALIYGHSWHEREAHGW